MMLTQRDKEIIHFLQKFKVANTSILAELFFPSLRMAQYRLKDLADHGVLRRSREYITTQNLYYLKKPKQLRHKLILTDFYRHLGRIASIQHFIPEKTIGSLIPDAIVGYTYKNNQNIAFVEVEISNNSIKNKIKVYEKLYRTNQYQIYFPIFPTVIIIADKKIPKVDEIKLIHIKEDLSNLEKILSAGLL